MGKRKDIAWDNSPPVRKFIPIISVKPNRPVTVFAVAPVLGVWAHFFDGRSWPCFKPGAKGCKWCQSQNPRWKGFLPCCLPSEARRILEITEKCGHYLSLRYPTGPQGHWITFNRTANYPNSPLAFRPDDSRLRTPAIPPFDAEPSVLHMWGIVEDEQLLDVHQGDGG